MTGQAASDAPLKVLRILDAPNLAMMAPELVESRGRVLAIGKLINGANCRSCEKNKAYASLVEIARTVTEWVRSHDDIADLLYRAAGQTKP